MKNQTEPLRLGWTSSPDTRGTFDIISSCLFTFFLCCWTMIHPDIGPPGSTLRHRVVDKALCFLLAVVAPEALTYKAFMEWVYATRTTVRYKDLAHRGVRWENVHGFYSMMGGFRAVQSEDSKGLLSPDMIFELLQASRIHPSDIPHKQDIMDKSKSDALIKALALLQVSTLSIQVIARAVQHLPITTLEISTLAFIPGSLCMVFFWWNKPYDVAEPNAIVIHPLITWPTQSTISTKDSYIHQDSQTIVSGRYFQNPTSGRVREIIFDHCLIRMNALSTISAGFFIVYGGIHCAAWNFSFSTPIEQTLWRASSLTVTIAIPLSWLITAACCGIWKRVARNAHFDSRGNPIIEHSFSAQNVNTKTSLEKKRVAIPIVQTIHGTSMILYGLARFYLLIEGFLALRSLPSGCYVTVSWPQYLPFLS
jgi:hypothetical protein